MKVYKDILQGTEQWFDIKWGKIGGTLSKGLFVDSDTLFLDLLSQHMEEFEYEEEGFKSNAMERGNDLEPFAREFLNNYTGLKFEEVGWLESSENNILGISPDGITSSLKQQCEIKCFSRKKHAKVVFEQQIPEEHLHQCLHAFAVNEKLESLFFIAFRPESIVNNFIKELKKDTLVDIGIKVKKEVEVIGKRGKPIKPKIVIETKLFTVDEVAKMIRERSSNMAIKLEKELNRITF